MEQNVNEKKVKASKPTSHAALRVRKETRKRVLSELAKINKKDFGRRIRADEYLTLAMSLVTIADIQRMQDASLSNADRLERDYRDYISKNAAMTKDVYLGKRLNGELEGVGYSKADEVVAVKSA